MNVLKPTYEILTPISENGIQELQFIEKVGRTCYQSSDRITEDGESAKKFVKMLLDKHHGAMLEHSILSVKFTVDRGVSHELVRHRLASFAQESTRYCNYSKDKFGNEINVIDIVGGIAFDNKMQDLDIDTISEIVDEWYQAIEDMEKHYMRMLELGATPQIARSVLANSTKTDIVITTNYREWRNIFSLRTPVSAHPQMREIIIALLEDMQTKIPIIFDDIEVE